MPGEQFVRQWRIFRTQTSNECGLMTVPQRANEKGRHLCMAGSSEKDIVSASGNSLVTFEKQEDR